QGIQACDFARPKYQPLPAQDLCPSPPRRCELDADSALGNDCTVSWDETFQLLQNAMERLLGNRSAVLRRMLSVCVFYVLPALPVANADQPSAYILSQARICGQP